MQRRAEASCRVAGLKCRVTARAKDVHSFARKLLDKPQPYDAVFDKAGIRLVVDYPDERDGAVALVKSTFETSSWTHDFIESTEESRFSYRGYHTDGGLRPEDFGELPTGARALRAEIQIHRPGEALWASVNHDLLYKSSIQVPRDVRRAVHRLSAVLELVDEGFNAARRSMLDNPEFRERQVLAHLERHFLRLTGRNSSARLSLVVVSALKAQLPPLSEIDDFVERKSEQIDFIYRHYATDFRHVLVHQPESLLIWQLASLQKQPELEADWPQDLPREELDGVLSVWDAG